MKKWILITWFIGLFCTAIIVTGLLLPPPTNLDPYQWQPPTLHPPVIEEIDYKALLEEPGPSPAYLNWEPGPLTSIKDDLARKLEPHMETGDILFRSSNAYAANGIPFSQHVERFTESDFSHASIVIRVGDDVYVLEIDDMGVHLYTFANWLITPSNPDFAIYKPKNADSKFIQCMKKEIDWFLVNKPPYDFLFSDPDKYYCVESVAEIYLRCGVKLCEPKTVREVMSPFAFRIFVPINDRMREEDGQALPTDTPLWFVGNEDHGLMSSEHLVKFYRHKEHV